MTSFNGEVCEYDALGNPVVYRGKTLEWTKIRRLAKFGDVEFTYNANGLRTSKTANGVTHSYILEGDKILRENIGTSSLTYYYGNNGIIGFNYNGVDYFYHKNIQGDVIAIYTSSGAKVASYVYDAWGNHKIFDANGNEVTTTTHIGYINPVRYRGYYYDVETGLYYVSSRYYDPEIGRWINADSQLNTSLGVLGLNQFSYCLNNPVNMVDYGGNKPGDLFDTMDEAARDFAEYINAKSIADNREYASYIYEVKVKTTVRITVPVYKILKIPFLPKWLTITITGTTTKTKYTYAKPKKGTKAGVVLPIMGYVFVSNKVALLHTHGKYLEEYGSGNDHFSPEDKQTAKFFKIPFYVATPLGTLRRYDPLTQSDVPLFDDLPYDKSHPRR